MEVTKSGEYQKGLERGIAGKVSSHSVLETVGGETILKSDERVAARDDGHREGLTIRALKKALED